MTIFNLVFICCYKIRERKKEKNSQKPLIYQRVLSQVQCFVNTPTNWHYEEE